LSLGNNRKAVLLGWRSLDGREISWMPRDIVMKLRQMAPTFLLRIIHAAKAEPVPALNPKYFQIL
jgi:hypothetical protein